MTTPHPPLTSLQTFFIGLYFAIWLVGVIFQFLVIRKLKAITRAGGESPAIARRMLEPSSISRSLAFTKFLYSSEVSRLTDAALRRNCQILRIAISLIALFLVAGFFFLF